MRTTLFRIFFVSLALPCVAMADSTSYSPRDSATELSWARLNLKRHLQQMQPAYPFVNWEVKLKELEKGLDKLKSRLPPNPVEASGEKDLRRLETQVDSIRVIRPKVEALIREMYVEVMLLRIEERMLREGRPFSPRGRQAFQRTLKPYEAGSLRPKTDWLARFTTLEKRVQDARSSWLFGWAEGALARRIEKLLRTSSFAEQSEARQRFTVESRYWERQLGVDATQAAGKIRALVQDFKTRQASALSALGQLQNELQPEMLLSDVLEQARQQGLEFSVETESRIEAALASRQTPLLMPVVEAMAAWKNLAKEFPPLLAKAEQEETQNVRKALAKAEQDRLEKERMEALALEQKKAEAGQREQFRRNLDAWRNMRLSDSGDLDSITQQAVATRTGKLQTRAHGSGRNPLRVEGPKFSDTLAFVEKFVVADARLDLSRMSLEEKTTQSSYVYAAPSGRTSQEDLGHFVQNVALGSFEAYYGFISYLAPEKWKPGKPLAWKTERQAETQVRDREFSYVDLVVDAHKKRPTSSATRASQARANMPANMLVIFDVRGGIRRFQPFGDPRKILVRSEDLVEGKLRYKFLSYGADRNNIYLYAIDAEIKISVPNPG